jgi:hypothetical protein
MERTMWQQQSILWSSNGATMSYMMGHATEQQWDMPSSSNEANMRQKWSMQSSRNGAGMEHIIEQQWSSNETIHGGAMGHLMEDATGQQRDIPWSMQWIM